MATDLANLLLKRFPGSSKQHAIQTEKGFAPVHSQITAPLLDNHLDQRQCYGLYLMSEANQVMVACVDFDNKETNPDPEWMDKAEHIHYAIQRAGLSSLVEISQSGCAAHVWMFFSEPVPAWLPRQFFDKLGRNLGVPTPEIYPRQDRLSGKNVGSLIRYPLWGKSRFVEPEDGWEATWGAFDALSTISPVDSTTLKHAAYSLGLGVLEEPQRTTTGSNGLPRRVLTLLEREGTLLYRRWHGDISDMRDKSTSAVAMSIATELVRLYVPTPSVEQAIRQWCEENGAEAKGRRDDWIATTVQNAYDFIGGRLEKKSETSLVTLKQACHEHLDSLESTAPRYMESGIRRVDDIMDGVAPGEVCVIAAPPSHGKTAFGIQWMAYLSGRGVPTLFISEEMSTRLIGERRCHSILGSGVCRADLPAARSKIDDHFAKAAPTYIVENCATVGRAVAVIDQMVAIHGVQAVAIDYLQLLGASNSSRYEVVTEVSRSLKQAAGRNSVAMFLLSQLNRESEKRTHDNGKWSPKLTDLRESGQIEQDADTVMFLRWPYRTDPKSNPDPKRYWLRVLKRRNGPIRNGGRTELYFDADRQVFE